MARDEETNAIAAVSRALARLKPDARGRVVRYVYERWVEDQKPIKRARPVSAQPVDLVEDSVPGRPAGPLEDAEPATPARNKKMYASSPLFVEETDENGERGWNLSGEGSENDDHGPKRRM